jgi:SAM-dependent methyltransferase
MSRLFVPITEKKFWNKRWCNDNLSYRVNLRWLRTYLYYRIDKVFSRDLCVQPGDSFFEVGCAGGKWLVYFSKVFGCRVSGIDYSDRGVLRALQTLRLAKIQAELVSGDVFRVEPAPIHDIVLSDGFLEHFDHPLGVLEHIAHYVKKGGYLITIIPNLTGFQRFLIYMFGHSRRIFWTHTPLCKSDLMAAYRALGFNEIHFHEVGSIIPKTFSITGFGSKILNGILRVAYLVGITLEGEKLSNTYVIWGRNHDERQISG